MADNGFISVKADVDYVMKVFDGFQVNEKAIQKSLLRAVGQGAKTYVKRNINTVLHKNTGTLQRSITSKLSRSGRSIVITNSAQSSKGVRYGFVLAAGWKAPKTMNNDAWFRYQAKLSKGTKVYGRIPKYKEQKTGLMTFNINGKWISTYRTEGKPRDFVEGPVEKYVGSADFNTRMDTALQKQIDYWDKRLGGGLR